MTKIKVTAQQRANAIEARDLMVPSIPTKNWVPGLSSYGGKIARRIDEHSVEWIGHAAKERKPCGAAACFGGWCSVWPSFQAQGVQPENDTSWLPKLPQGKGKRTLTGPEVAEKLFGEPRLFDPIDPDEESADEKRAVLNRLKKLINNSEVI